MMMDILSRLKHLISSIMPRTISLNAYIWKMIPLFLNIMFPLCLLLNRECQADLKASLEHGHHIVLLHWMANNEIFNFQQYNRRIEDNLRYDAERTCLFNVWCLELHETSGWNTFPKLWKVWAEFIFIAKCSRHQPLMSLIYRACQSYMTPGKWNGPLHLRKNNKNNIYNIYIYIYIPRLPFYLMKNYF